MPTRKDDPKLWTARVEAFETTYRRVKGKHDNLEAAVAGDFPLLIPGGRPVTSSSSFTPSGEQVETNLLLRAADYFLSLCYDGAFSVRFSRTPGLEKEKVGRVERGVEQVLDEGDLSGAMRRSTLSSFTRGPSIVWIDLGQGAPSVANVIGTKAAAAQMAFAASQGYPITLGPGMNFKAISAAARSLVSPLGPDGEPNPIRLSMTEEAAANVTRLAEDAEKMDMEELEALHPIYGQKGRISFQATPLGSWCGWDNTAIDPKMIAWAYRNKVFTHDEFLAEPAFTDEAKRHVETRSRAPEFDVEGARYADMDPDVDRAENQAIMVRECWDKRRWKLHYVCDGFDKFLEKDSRYPYMNENGRPIFDGFFPFDVTTPLIAPRQKPTDTFGVPILAPGLAHQYEYIKTRSKYLSACKASGRIVLLSGGVSDEFKQTVEEGQDLSVGKLDANYDPQRSGPPMTVADFGSAPNDYLVASQMIERDFCKAVGISWGALNTENVAPTATQEQIATAGVAITQGDKVRMYEEQAGRLAQMTVRMMTLLPDDALAPYFSPMPPAEARAILLRLGLEKVMVRFAVNTRGDDAVRIKQLTDTLMAVNAIVSPLTKLPIKDPTPILEELVKANDIDALPAYMPKPEELQLMAMMGAMGMGGQKPQGEDREAPGGGREDGRRAGGERGPPPSPGRQSRDRGPASYGNQAGIPQRARTATS